MNKAIILYLVLVLADTMGCFLKDKEEFVRSLEDPAFYVTRFMFPFKVHYVLFLEYAWMVFRYMLLLNITYVLLCLVFTMLAVSVQKCRGQDIDFMVAFGLFLSVSTCVTLLFSSVVWYIIYVFAILPYRVLMETLGFIETYTFNV